MTALDYRGERRALLVLAGSYFALGVGSLSVVGLVEPMSVGLNVSRGAIAYLITAFAFTYAIAAPLMQIFLGDRDRRRLLVIGMAGIALGSLLCAVSPNYTGVMIGRTVMAVGGALAGPMTSAAAAALVPAERRGAALGLAFTGLTLSTVAGVPLSSWGGDLIGWRAVMICIAAVALLVALCIHLFVPKLTGGQRVSAQDLVDVLSDRILAPALSVTLLQVAGGFCTYALIGVYLNEVQSVPLATLPLALAVYGAGGVVGNILATRFTDRLGFNRMISVSLTGIIGVFVLMIIVPGHPVGAIVMLFAWSAIGLMLFAPLQTRLVSLGGKRSNLLLALNSSAVYVGMAIGSAVCGFVYEKFGSGYFVIV